MIGTRTATPKGITISIGPGNTIAEPERGSFAPSGRATFVVENGDSVPHTVSLPLEKFVPHPAHPTAPGDPIERGPNSVRVAANDTGTIALTIKNAGYFTNTKRPIYKYTIVSDGKERDPEIEINN